MTATQEQIQKERERNDPPEITASGWPNLYPPSIVLAVIAVIAFFLFPAERAGKIVAFAVFWWVVVVPVVIIVTGGNAWQEFPDDSGRSGRPDA